MAEDRFADEDFREVGGSRFSYRTTATTQTGGDVIVTIDEILIGQEFTAERFELE